MNPELKAMWIAALRSGEFDQGRGKLRNDNGYCCLGVLAVIQGAALDYMVQDSVELELDGKDYNAGLSRSQRSTLADMNDGRGCEPRSFDHIAGYIQAMIEDTP